MFGFGGKFKGSGKPIGVAVTTRNVYLAQQASAGFVFEREALSDDVDATAPNFHTETQRAISTVLRRGKFAGRQAVSALPAELLRYKTLRLPAMPEGDMAQAVAWEAAERFQITDNQSLQQYRAGQVNQGDEKREEIILLAAENNAINDHANAVKGAGLIPIAIDATGAALARLLGSENQSTLTIHLGQTTAEVVGHRGEKVIFDKPIEMTKQGDTIDTKAFCREVSLCMRYMSVTFGVHKPDAAWVAGHGGTQAFAQAMSESLHTQVRPADQSAPFKNIDLPDENAGNWCVAMGLAMRNSKVSAKRGAA